MEPTGKNEKSTTREFVGRTGGKFEIVIVEKKGKEYALIKLGLVAVGVSEFPCATKYIQDNDVPQEHLDGTDRMSVYCVPIESLRFDCAE